MRDGHREWAICRHFSVASMHAADGGLDDRAGDIINGELLCKRATSLLRGQAGGGLVLRAVQLYSELCM